MKKLLTFLTLLTLFFATGWAETGTIWFGNQGTNINSASVHGNDDKNNTWYITTVGTTSFTQNQAYSQVGSSKAPATSITFTTTLPSSVNVTSMEAKFGGFSGTAGTVNLKVGDINIGTGSLNGTNDVTISSNSTAIGNTLTVTVTNIDKGVKCYYISYTYEGGGTTPSTYEVNIGSMTNGTVTASPSNGLSAGEEVTLTINPSSGYELDNLTVTGDNTNTQVSVNNNKFIMPAENVTVNATFIFQGTEYELVTDASTLKNGDKLIITNVKSGNGYAMSTTQNTNNRGRTPIEVNDSKIAPTNTTQIVTLETATNGWYLKVDNQYLFAPNVNGNYLRSGTDIDETYYSTISINSSSVATINLGNKNIKYNSNNAIFSCYTSGQNDVYLFREPSTKTFDVTVTQPAEGGTITASPVGEKVVDAGDKVTVTATPADGYELSSWTITGASESEPDANNQITATGNVNITATFGKVQYSITNVVKTNGEVSGAGGSLNNWTGVSTVNGVWGAKMGDEISFRADTYNGYQIREENISITDASGNAVTFTFNNNVVTFTMPASNVTITANYTNYRGKLRLAGHFNGNSTWRSGDTGPEFTYDSTDDKYTISAYFTGIDDGGANDFFCLTLDGAEKHPQADQGNYYIYDLNGGAMPFNLSGGSSNNFGCAPGVYNIEINGALTSMKFTKVNPTISFTPAAGEVEQGTSVSASSTLTSLIADVKTNYDSNAAGEVTVGVNTDNSNTWNASETLSTVGSATVYGKAYIGNINVTGNANYTVVKANTSNVYELTTTLTSGKKYIIMSADSGSGYALGEQATNNRRGSAEYTITENKVTIGSDVQVITIEGDATNGWYFNVGNGYLYAASSSSNYLKTEAEADDNAKAAISFDGNAATIRFQGTNTRNLLRFNPNNGGDYRIFACYSGITDQNHNVYLFQQTAEETKDYTITYAEVTGGSATGATEANEGEQITVTVTANDGYAATGITVNPSVEVTDNHDGTYTFTMPASNVTITPSFAQAYDITYVAEPAAGGIVTGVTSAVYDARVEVTVTPNADYQLSGTPTYTYNGITQQLAGAGTAESPYYFNMPGYATTVTANFVKIPHGITVVSTHGDVTGIPETATSGTQVTFTVTPNAGYVVSNVSGTFNNGNSSLNITDNGDGTYTFNMPASDVAITVTYFASEDYELLTDLADINAEDTYLIVGGPVAGGYVNVMGKKTDNSTMGFTALTSSNYDSETGIITSDENMAVVNFLVSNGTYAIHTADGYVNESSVTASTPFYWSIDLDATSSRAQITSDNKHFSYNSSAPRWKSYNSEQGASYIFKLANKNKVKRPTITGAAGEFLGQYNFIGKDNVSMACATDGATIEYSLDSGNTWQSYSEAFEISTNAAGNTVEVQARATKTDMEPSDVVTATFTCIKPTAPTFGNNEAGAYVNPVFVYPKSALNDRRAYGEESVSFCYTTNGTDADASSPAVATSNSNGYYIVLDDNATLSVVTVINDIASDPAGGAYTFSVDAPTFSLAGGNYDGNQQTRLSTGTKTQQNNLTWNTVIYYTTGNTEFAFNATTGEVTSEGWVAYDPTNSPYIDILAANGTTTIKAVTLSNYFNGQSEYRASDVTTETYVLTAANLSITISPAAGTYVNAQNVTLGVKNNIGDYIIYYTTDGSDPNTNGIEYTGTPITVDHDMTIKVYAVDSRTGDGGTATAEAVYKIGIQPVVYSPFPGTIYKGDDEDINVEMFSVSPNAKIYYTVAEGEGNYPDDPTTSSTLYSEPIPLETGKVYNFKAIAVVGSLVSTVTPGTFTVQAKGNGWLNVNEMANSSQGTSKTLDNPVQVVYMSTWRNGQDNPNNLSEFCFVRDNSGYGLIYFGNGNITDYNDYAKFQMGDWLEGGKIAGTMANWSSSFINELGGNKDSGYRVTGWPSTSLGNTAILPEETTNKAITDGWTYEGSYSGSNYKQYIDPDKNLFGHYVHMRKNTIKNVTGAGGGTEKHIGIITDQSGVPLNYYDGLYLFSGYNGSVDYDQTFFDNIQNNGGTFDVYAIVYFYGPNASNSSYSNAPYEIFPIDFEWIYKPLFNINPEETTIYHEPQTISLTCETEGAQIWYKTSEMEAYELYTGPFEVDATTTIESYSTLPSKYNDVLESVINSITVTIGTVEAPVITEQSVVKTVGESVTTDITCTTEGATIYYTTDGSDPKTSETRIEYTLGQQLIFDETTTVRAIAMQDGYYSVEAESRTYTFVKSNGIEYALVTNASQLNENSVYVIVNKANNMAMSTNQKTNNRDAAGVMFKNVDKTIVYGNDDLAQFTLKKTGNNWYIQTNNSSENGYLSVGNGNTLLTNATADGNAEATITIDGTNSDVDKANEAHISFIYNNETTRYLRYWNRDHLFNTYTTETNAPVFLYYIEATPLATIEKEGVKNKQYTIADELVVVWANADEGKLWCKDQGNVSIAKTEIKDGQVDYMKEVGQQHGEWDQSNWVVLQFPKPTMPENDPIKTLLNNAVGKYIEPATVTGYYIDDNNYTIQMAQAENYTLALKEGADTTKNVYCTANFLPDNLNIKGQNGAAGIYHGENRNYFFMNPKIQEVCSITFAEWIGDNTFVVPVNDAQINGSFKVDWTYNAEGPQSPASNTAYRFVAAVQRPQGSTYLKADQEYPIIVYPLDFTAESALPTAINTVEVGNGEIKSIKYVNVAGIVSDRPFQGVNIVVTEYTDGSRTTTKMLCK